MIKKDLFNHRSDIKQGVEREWIAGHDAMRLVPLNAHYTAGPSMFGDDFPTVLRNVIRPEPETYFDHFLAVFGFKRGWIRVWH